MGKLVGWKDGHPNDTRVVQVLRELNNGERCHWKCFYDWGWYTHDGIRISGVLGWRELKK